MSNRELIQTIQDELAHRLLLGLATNRSKPGSNRELYGYPESSEVPDYRVLHGLESLGIFMGIGDYQLRNVQLSLSGLPVVPAAALIGLLDAVRNKALSFALEIERRLEPETEPESQDQSGDSRRIGF
jgi:hypothetical protein